MAIHHPRPNPEGVTRQIEASTRRDNAINMAATRASPPPVTSTNGEEQKYAGTWPSNFTKGLPHTEEGIVDDHAYELFVDAINQPDPEFKVPLGPANETGGPDPAYRPNGYNEHPDARRSFYCGYFYNPNNEQIAPIGVRSWESPLAGHVYDLEGPDADALAMERGPTLGSSELSAELAEVYAMALLRDVPFTKIENATGSNTLGIPVSSIVEGLNSLPWFNPQGSPVTSFPDSTGNPYLLTLQEQRRRIARTHEPLDELAPTPQALSAANLFRGSVPGAKHGPFISQFLLLGTEGRNGPRNSDHPTDLGESPTRHNPEDGLIVYGAQTINQRVYPQRTDLDYMTDWPSWLDVQNGANVGDATAFEQERRFITTPRDLASFVHYDALYQAYLNACLILLHLKAPFQQGFPSGQPNRPARGSFATFGPPHILTLVTETATRALKAVRRQKFNYHRRARPEALGAALSLVVNNKGAALGEEAKEAVNSMLQELKRTGLLDFVHTHNARQSQRNKDIPHRNPMHCPARDSENFAWLRKNYLLPMAFPEGLTHASCLWRRTCHRRRCLCHSA